MTARRLLAAVLTAAAILLARPAFACGADRTYNVSGTGDSILFMTADQLDAPGRWIDTERGRQPYIPGQQNRYSTEDIWPLVLAHSKPGGWIVIQDNAAQTSDDAWRKLVQRIVWNTPNDRCLLGVLPVFLASESPLPDAAERQADAFRKARIMRRAFAFQPCHRLVEWPAAVRAKPGLVFDGQHPSADGVAWLAWEINEAVRP